MRLVSHLLLQPFASCSSVDSVIVFFTSFELLTRILTLLFARMDWLVGLLRVRHKFVS